MISSFPKLFKSNTAKIILLAALYMLTGKLGLLLAAPPGYATVIWPPSGIAIGMILLYGWRLYPGILIGSFLLNVCISDAFTAANGLDEAKTWIAAGIAVASTLQALIARILVKRYVGLPIVISTPKNCALLFFLTAGVSCLTAATLSNAVLYYFGHVPLENLGANWMTWWTGDAFGVLIFLSLVLLSPFNPNPLQWRGKSIDSVPLIAILTVLLPLGLTFYAWKVTALSVFDKQYQEFETLVLENQKALEHRVSSYGYALLGGAGFVEGSSFVSKKEWNTYVDNMDIAKNFPGMKGMGLAVPVEQKNLAHFVREMRRENTPDFTIHPLTENRPNNIIMYINPVQDNNQAVGLNIGFEDNRLEASNLSRDTGKPVITKKIVLLQSIQHEPGFLLLHPVYNKKMPLNTIDERRKAHTGWIYAPFVARNFLTSLTKSQGNAFNLRIYDKGVEAPENLIYSSDNTEQSSGVSDFAVRKQINIMQQKWLLVWKSTSSYEQEQRNDSPLFVLWGGLLFTIVFSIFTINMAIRRADTMQLIAEEKKFVIPLLIFSTVFAASFYLYDTLKQRELDFVQDTIEQESKNIDRLIFFQTSDKLQALKRMAQRWEVANRTPRNEWQADAYNYTSQLVGLKAIEWIDPTSHVKWVEPYKGNEKAIGLNILFDETRKNALRDAAERNSITVTPPINLVQGYRGFIAYAPLKIKGKFDGYIAGVFSTDEFINNILKDDFRNKYDISIQYGGEYLYKTKDQPETLKKNWKVLRTIQVYDKEWVVKITPTESFVQSRLTSLPDIILICGFLISVLLALTFRSILVSRVKSHHLLMREETLKRSLNLNTAIMESATSLIIATDTEGKVILFNKAAENALGYDADEIIGKETPALWHKMEEVIERAEDLTEELGRTIEPGFEVFVAKATMDGVESREWTLIKRDGSEFFVNLTATPLLDGKNEIVGYLGVIEDVTERTLQQMSLKISEETFRSAMEYASIGMALVDTKGAWLKVNRALCDLLGYSRVELLMSDFQSVTHPDDLDQDLHYSQQLLEGEIPNYQLEKRYIHKNGHIIWVLLSVSLVQYFDGKPKYFVAQIQDITHQKEVNRIKSEFISIVSHELRTPLTSIRGSLGLIATKMADQLPEKVTRLIQIAHENSERLILLINDILDIDKIASGQMRFDIKEENLEALLQKSVEANHAYAEKFNLSIDLSPVDKNLKIKVDSARFIQVLSNFLSNAAKFSPENGKIDVYATASDYYVRICVKDYGPGIPEEFKSRIFGKFSQADSSITRDKGGTGLGLHISKEIVEHMSGHIGFDSELGQGTIFWAEFPLIGTETAIYDLHVQDSNKSSSDLPHILHVEDDSGLTEFFANALQDKAKITPAGTLMQAMEYLKNEEFSLIILDILMPDGSGMDLLNYLHENDHHIPVMVLSAVEVPEDIRKRVSSHMVKSRMSETRIIEEILSLIDTNKDEKTL